MREIKFRAWNKETKKMSDGESLASWCLTEMNNGIAMGHVKMPQEHYDNREDFHSHLELMQYTGLKDKNGIEIYEGDILRTEDGLGRKSIEVISWEENGFWIKTETGQFYLPEENLREVFGNIYEHSYSLDTNPELLEGKK